MGRRSEAAKKILAGASTGPVTRAIATWDGNITAEAINRVHEIRLKDIENDRKSGMGRFRGSNLGQCPRKQLMSYVGYEGADPDDVGRELMREGTYRHYFWQEVGLSAGFLRDAEVKTARPDLEFGGQLDGEMLPQPWLPGFGVFELKNTKWSRWSETKAKVNQYLLIENPRMWQAVPFKHALQAGTYCESTGAEWVSFVYELRGDRMEWFEVVVEYDDELRGLVKAEFEMLHGWRDRKTLPPVKEGYPKDNECSYWCSFKRICPSAEY